MPEETIAPSCFHIFRILKNGRIMGKIPKTFPKRICVISVSEKYQKYGIFPYYFGRTG
jgi:hypothetical protein